MKVSIIVPIYNVEKYLRRCVDSLLAQTYKNTEIILIDDGSTDSSGKIADEYRDIHPEIVVIHKQNGGLADARNCGIENSTGDYLCFADSDDFIPNNAIENLLNPIISHKCDLVVSGYYLDYFNDGYTVNFAFDEERFFTKEEINEAIYKIEKLNFNVVWNKLYSSNVIKGNSLLFDIDGMPGEDLLFNCKYMMCKPSVALITAKTYHYMRQDEDSLAGKYRDNLHSQVLRFIGARKEMYDFFGLTEQKHQEIYAKTFVNYIFSCVPNLYKKQCSITRKQKKEELRKILNTPYLYENLKTLKNKTQYQKLMEILYCVRKTCLALAITDILFFVRYRLEPLYKKIRKSINKR